LEKFGLSENFIYFDDDFFVGKELNKSNFFYYDENEKRVVPSLLNSDFNELNKAVIISKYNYIYNLKDKMASQSFMAWLLSLLSTEKFFMEYYKDLNLIIPVPSHNAISYNVKDLKEIYDLIVNNYQYANETLNSIERHILTLQTQHCVDLYEFNIKKRKVHTIPSYVLPMDTLALSYMYIELFAINTGGDKIYTESEYKRQKELMKQRFPIPTPYEITENKNIKKKEVNVNIKIPSISKKISEHEINSIKRNNWMMVLNNQKDSKIEEDKDFQIRMDILSKIIDKQALLIKLNNYLIILLLIVIAILIYFYYREAKKSKYNSIKVNDDK
jgi:hypothetical protein